MLKEYSRLLGQIFRLFDLFLTLGAFLAAYYLRNSQLFINTIQPAFSALLGKELGKTYSLGQHADMLWVILPLWFLLLHYFGCYSPLRTASHVRIGWILVKAVLTGSAVVGCFIFLTKAEFFNRPIFILFAVINFLLLFGSRIALKEFQGFARRKGLNFRNVLIVGSGKKALSVISEINARDYWGYKIVGIIDKGASGAENEVLGVRIIGTIDQIEEILRKEPVDDVFWAAPEAWGLETKRYLRLCEVLGVFCYLVPDEYDLDIAKADFSNLGKLQVIRFSPVPTAVGPLAIKKIMDIVLALLLLPIFLAIYLIVGMLIKIDSKGPILYTQKRVTKNRRSFSCYKFRTMVQDADRRLGLLEQQNEMQGPIRKSRADPRVTRVGRFLRKWSIDEFPQIINVLKGEMSIVGPRPPTPDEVEQYALPQLRKLSMRQGITGLWQVSGRDSITNFEDRLKFDLQYIDNWSLWLDIKILLKTCFVVFKGAY
jgi:exopolysaccharide biosynthesis polyprenyl glycosylphosphotransferase